MAETMTGTCKYCGQVQNVRAFTEQEADIIASDNCDCSESKLAQKKKQVFADIEEISKGNLNAPTLSYEVVELLKFAAEKIIKNNLNSSTFKLGSCTITIKETTSKIKVTRKDVTTTSVES